MSTPKDIPTQRPSSQHGSSLVSSIPARHSMSRNHSHSVSLGTFNPDHRVTRRKSVNMNSISNAGAIKAAMNGLDEVGSRSSHRRSLNSKPTSASRNTDMSDNKVSGQQLQPLENAEESAVADEIGTGPNSGPSTKARARRASEGSHLTGRRASGELKCDKCGKGYKHSSCLTKHLWEHTPEWALTSKLLISKHQQVQLLEAASVLVGMNLDAVGDLDRSKPSESDNSSASPAASGSSGLPDEEGYSSAETTPPPMHDGYGLPESIHTKSKRHSGTSSSFSRSYKSAPSSSLPSNNGFAGLGMFSPSSRPSTSGLGSGTLDEDEAGLVAAVQSLCSFGTPRNGPVLLPLDVPPVPPLPARFMEKPYEASGPEKGYVGSNRGTINVQEVSDRDVEMEEGNALRYSKEQHSQHQAFDEADEGVFGGMEGLAHEAHETLASMRSS